MPTLIIWRHGYLNRLDKGNAFAVAAIRNFLQKYWLALFLAVSVGYIVFYIVDQLGQLQGAISLSPLPLVASFIFQIAFWVVASHLWSTALYAVSGAKVGITDCFFQLCLVNLGKYIPGKVWGVVARASYCEQRHGIDIGRNLQATYIEQIYLIGSAAILAALIVAALGSNLVYWVIAPMIAVTIIIATVYQRPLLFLIRLLNRLRRQETDIEVSKFHVSPGLMVRLLMQYLVVWVLLGCVMYGIYLALYPAQLSVHMAAVITLSCVVGVSVGFLAVFAPGGVGVREAVSAVILAEYMPLADTVLLVLLFRLWLAALEVFVGGGLYLRMRSRMG